MSMVVGDGGIICGVGLTPDLNERSGVKWEDWCMAHWVLLGFRPRLEVGVLIIGWAGELGLAIAGIIIMPKVKPYSCKRRFLRPDIWHYCAEIFL